MTLRKWTNERIDQWLIDNNICIKRVGISNGVKHKIEFKCLLSTCNYSWKTTPGSLIGHHTHCPNCQGCAKLTNLNIDKFLVDNHILIERLGNIINNVTKTEWRCLKQSCNYTWHSAPANIKAGHGCPKCAGNLPLTNQYIDKYLLNNNILIKRIDNIGRARENIKWQCLELGCNHIWLTSPNCIQQGTKCPLCNINGYCEQSIKKYLEFANIEHIWQFKIPNNYSKKQFFIIDFYLPKLSTFIEYHGGQHYMPVKFKKMANEQAKETFEKQQRRDQYVREYCKSNKMTLIEINGTIYNNSNKINKYLIDLFHKSQGDK